VFDCVCNLLIVKCSSVIKCNTANVFVLTCFVAQSMFKITVEFSFEYFYDCSIQGMYQMSEVLDPSGKSEILLE
jgi:hypothetical protein